MFFQQCRSVHVLLLWTKFHWKIPLGKRFFKFWPKSKWREIKISYLGAILKQYNIFIFIYLFIYLFIYFYFILFFIFFSELWFFYSAYIYGANVIAKFQWESGFLREDSPLPAPTEVKVPWSLLSVNEFSFHKIKRKIRRYYHMGLQKHPKLG